MKKSKEVTVPREFVERAYESACNEWKRKIKEVIPDIALKTGKVPGSWCVNINHGNCVVLIPTNPDQVYTTALHAGDANTVTFEFVWNNSSDRDYREATHKELEEAFGRPIYKGI